MPSFPQSAGAVPAALGRSTTNARPVSRGTRATTCEASPINKSIGNALQLLRSLKTASDTSPVVDTFIIGRPTPGHRTILRHIAATLSGTIVDSENSRPVAGRVYLTNAAGEFSHVQSENGTAIPYKKIRSDLSLEVHTTISAHPFHAQLPSGDYTITVEKGKEYFPATCKVTVPDDKAMTIRIALKRWANMAERSWYSGETHVHREVEELPTLQLAEDINVAFPLTAWVTDSEQIPAKHNNSKRSVPPAKLVRIDKTHVFGP